MSHSLWIFSLTGKQAGGILRCSSSRDDCIICSGPPCIG